MVRAVGFFVVETRLQVEDRFAVLDRDDATRREAPTVADPVHLVQDRPLRIAGPQEVGVQRVDVATGLVDRSARRDERLTGDLAAEHANTILVGRSAPEDVDLDHFEVEQCDEVVEGLLIRVSADGMFATVMWCSCWHGWSRRAGLVAAS